MTVVADAGFEPTDRGYESWPLAKRPAVCALFRRARTTRTAIVFTTTPHVCLMRLYALDKDSYRHRSPVRPDKKRLHTDPPSCLPRRTACTFSIPINGRYLRFIQSRVIDGDRTRLHENHNLAAYLFAFNHHEMPICGIAPYERFELPTVGSVNRCSIQLN